MSVKPPQFAHGLTGNDSAYAPEVWSDIQPSQNETISRNDMINTSTVEYKGYYKAQSTGFHRFQLTGGADGFAWVSSANSSSDHIDIAEKVDMVADTSFGIRIPARPAGANYWAFQDTGGGGVLGGNFPGYGYWPLEGYGTSPKWGSYFNSKSQVTYNHGSFLPGDIRTYSTTSNTSYGQCPTYCSGEPAGPGWNNPEDANWNDNDLTHPCESTWNNSGDCRNEGRLAQIYLSEAYVAGGKKGEWENPQENEPFMVWPIAQPMAQGALQNPERVQVYWKLKFKETGRYKLRFTTKYGVKMWYNLTPNKDENNNGGAKSLRRLDPASGINPIVSGGGSFTSEIFEMTSNQRLQLVGNATGNQATGEVGIGLEILDADDEDAVIWDTSRIVQDASALIGISECGYHALLDDADRIPENGISEFYKDDGWLGYEGGNPEGKFNADIEVGDLDQRTERDTRQYLWENCTALLYDSQSRPGFVYLRADDFYFIRVVVTNQSSGTGQGFAFQVTDPGSNSLQQVVFSGNGDPNADATVGGGVGGSGIPINKDALCNSVLYSNNVPNTSTTFGLIRATRSVLNLSNLGVPEAMLGTEGQQESVPNRDPDVPAGDDGIDSYLVNVGGTSIKLAVLLQGGENGIPAMTTEQKSAVRTVATNQLNQSLTLSYGEFRNAITSQAVINFGSSGNYTYLYHAVGEVIQSICDDNFTLEAPEVINKDNTTSLVTGTGDCVDLNIQGYIENSGYVSISSACVEDCKPYDQYEIPSNMQSGAASSVQYMGTLPKYEQTESGDYYTQILEFGNDYYAVDVFFPIGKIMSWGFFVPDILPSLNEEEYDERNTSAMNGKFDINSNTYFNLPDSAAFEGNYGPWIMVWASLTPGGEPLGGRGGVVQSRANSVTGGGFDAKISMEPYIRNLMDNSSSSAPILYVGNSYGKRYINMAVVKYENFVDNIYAFFGDTGFKPADQILYPGDDGFETMLSNYRVSTRDYRLSLRPPTQKCTEGGSSAKSKLGSGGIPAPHSGSGLPSYVDYRPDDDYLSGSTGFGIEGVSTFRGLGRVYFEPCTVRSIPFLIIPGQTSGAIKGVPRAPSFYEDTPGSKTGLSCPGSTLNLPGKKSDGTNYQPSGSTFGWFSRNPGEWDPNTISLFQSGGEIEFVSRFTESNNYLFNLTEPTWLYMNFAGFDYSLANNNPASQSNPMVKIIVPDFNNLWPYRGFYWVMSDKN